MIEHYREGTFRYDPRQRLLSEKEAVQFVNERGFVFFWPITGFDFPSLWCGVAGNRAVPNQHDDPAHITWRWKDNLLGKGVWYYGKVLRQKSTIISLNLLPSFYTLSPNYGEPEQDYLFAYQDGTLSIEEKLVFEAILEHGPLDSIMLREKSRLSSKDNSSRFSRALNLLMRDFRICPVGVAEAGTWNYAFIYDAVHQHFPSLPQKARLISEDEARANILQSLFISIGAEQTSTIRKLFQWPIELIERSLGSLLRSEFLFNQVKFENKDGEWWALASLAN